MENIKEVTELLLNAYFDFKGDLESIGKLSEGKIIKKEFSPGDVILSYNERLTHLLFVYQGAYFVFRYSKDGRINVIANNSAPQFLGTIQMSLKDEIFLAEVIASSHCEVLLIDSTYLLELIKEDHRVSLLIIDNLSKLLRSDTDKIDSMVFNDGYERLLLFLYFKIKENKSEVTEITESKRILGDLIGVHERSVFRILKELENDGYISVDKRIIRINKEQQIMIEKKVRDILAD